MAPLPVPSFVGGTVLLAVKAYAPTEATAATTTAPRPIVFLVCLNTEPSLCVGLAHESCAGAVLDSRWDGRGRLSSPEMGISVLRARDLRQPLRAGCRHAANTAWRRPCTSTLPRRFIPILSGTRSDASFSVSITAMILGTSRCARPAARQARAAS